MPRRGTARSSNPLARHPRAGNDAAPGVEKHQVSGSPPRLFPAAIDDAAIVAGKNTATKYV